MAQELVSSGEVAVQVGSGEDNVLARNQAQVLDGRDSNVATSGSSAEVHITKLQGQLAWVHNLNDRGELDSWEAVKVGVDQVLVCELQVVQSSERNLGVESNAVDGHLSKDSEVQLCIDGSLQCDGVRWLGGKGTNEGGEGSVCIRENSEGYRWEGCLQNTAATNRGSSPWGLDVSELLGAILWVCMCSDLVHVSKNKSAISKVIQVSKGTYTKNDVLADFGDWERDAGDGEHGGNNVAGGSCWGPWVGASEVHGHLVDSDALDESEIDSNSSLAATRPCASENETGTRMKGMKSVRQVEKGSVHGLEHE